MTTDDETFGPILFRYTRKEAIDDGVLVDVTDTAREAGIRYPTAVTDAVWQRYVAVPDTTSGQDEAGRLWDILWMFRVAVARSRGAMDTLVYRLLVRNDEGPAKEVTLKALCGPGDDGEPVITIMLPDED